MEDEWSFVCVVVHVYKDVWDPYLGDSFTTKHEQNSQPDKNVTLAITHAFTRHVNVPII